MSKEVVLENGIRITGATLLTYREAEKLPEEIRAIGCWWWLRSPGSHGSYAANVLSGGSVDYGGYGVDLNFAVRPALDIQNLESSDLKIGDMFQFGDKDFEIISDTRALCKESVGKCAFREDWLAEDANNYETSDIKKFVDDWYRDAINLLSKSVQKEDKTGNTIHLENGLEITGVTLLTVEEAEKLSEETRGFYKWWWLRSPGCDSNHASFVDSSGSVDCSGFRVDIDTGAVRPALIIGLESSDFKIGDLFIFGDKRFEIISGNSALCMERIGECAFRKDEKTVNYNDYEMSDIKKFVDDWYENECKIEGYDSDEKEQKSMLDIANIMTKSHY